MMHLSDEQMVAVYYEEPDVQARTHLDQCTQCRSAFEHTRQLLDDLREYSVPERNAVYGSEVWARLLPRLPARESRPVWVRWWAMAPAVAALVALAFFAGLLTERQTNIAGTPAKARERVLLIAMGDHLDRSQIVLAELVNAGPGTIDLSGERARARDLLHQNRLLRQAAFHNGDALNAALLDELERVLLDIANSPADAPAAGLESLRRRMEDENILFKVRIFSTNVHLTGQNL